MTAPFSLVKVTFFRISAKPTEQATQSQAGLSPDLWCRSFVGRVSIAVAVQPIKCGKPRENVERKRERGKLVKVEAVWRDLDPDETVDGSVTDFVLEVVWGNVALDAIGLFDMQGTVVSVFRVLFECGALPLLLIYFPGLKELERSRGVYGHGKLALVNLQTSIRRQHRLTSTVNHDILFRRFPRSWIAITSPALTPR